MVEGVNLKLAAIRENLFAFKNFTVISKMFTAGFAIGDYFHNFISVPTPNSGFLRPISAYLRRLRRGIANPSPVSKYLKYAQIWSIYKVARQSYSNGEIY